MTGKNDAVNGVRLEVDETRGRVLLLFADGSKLWFYLDTVLAGCVENGPHSRAINFCKRYTGGGWSASSKPAKLTEDDKALLERAFEMCRDRLASARLVLTQRPHISEKTGMFERARATMPRNGEEKQERTE